MLKIDLFGERAEFLIAGASSYSSICGALISLIIVGTVFAYAGNKFSIMSQYGDTRFKEVIN